VTPVASVTDLDAIRAQVEERRRYEEETFGGEPPAGGGGGDITTKVVAACLHQNERGDGVLFSRLQRGKFLYVKRTGQWMTWNGVHWQIDTRNLAMAAVEEVAARYDLERQNYDKMIAELPDDEKDKCNGKKTCQCKECSFSRIRNTFARRVERLRSVKGVDNCLKFAHQIGVESLAIVGDEIDQKPWLLPCKNGVVDLRTGLLQPGRPDDHLVTAIPVEFPDCGHYLATGEGSPCPTWERVMLEIHREDAELAAFVQRWIGYNITGLIREHYIGVFVGAGRNGKGTLFETVKAVMGPLAWSIQPDMILEQKNPRSSAGPSADLMSLYGKRLVIASETDEGKRISGARVKWLTGGDSISARSPHDKFEINFRPSHKLNLYTNHVPKGLTKDFALLQRLLFIEYPLRYVDDPAEEAKRDPANAGIYRKKDPELMDKLRKEYPGILAWLVRGCLLWQAHGMNPPPSIRANVDKLKHDEDIFGQWFTDCCEESDPGWYTHTKELYGVFEKWFHEHKDEAQPSKWGCTRQKMGDWIDARGYKREKIGGQIVVYGISVRPEISFA